jgi:glucose/mannose-6-phosphate isomerase
VDFIELQKKLDEKGMMGLVETFPAQMQEAWVLGKEFAATFAKGEYSRIVLCGVGGSAIAGDMVRSYLGNGLEVPFYVSRSYDVPAHLARGALCIVSSYSGNTGEALLSYESLRAHAKSVIAFTSGGKLEELSSRDRIPLCKIPGGMPPRAAIAYSFFPTLHAVSAAGLCQVDEAEFLSAKEYLEKVCSEYSPAQPGNRAQELAQALHGCIPFVYSAGILCEAVARRWCCQINENSKSLAHFASFTELNHNEIVGWEYPADLLNHIVIVSLEDEEDHELAKRQRDICLGIVEPLSAGVIRVESAGESRMARLLSAMILGDFASVYLALINGVNPTPVEKIDYLKMQLGRGTSGLGS